MRILLRGQARSGTSILTAILTREPEMFLGHELRLYDSVFRMRRDNTDTLKDVGKKLRGVHAKRMQKYSRRGQKYGIEMDYEKIIQRLEKKVRNNINKKELMLLFEQEIFGDRFRVFGDKVPQPPTPYLVNAMLREGIDFKIIWIYRDGRDVVASRYRHKVATKIDPHWAISDVKAASNLWAEGMMKWDLFYKDYKDRIPILVVRFEDIIDDREKLITQLSEFVEVNESILRQNIEDKFSDKISHRGYYKEWIPSWEKEFVLPAKMYLAKLGYIEDQQSYTKKFQRLSKIYTFSMITTKKLDRLKHLLNIYRKMIQKKLSSCFL